MDDVYLAIAERIADGDAELAEHVKKLLSHPRTESSIKRAFRVKLPLLWQGESALVGLLKRSGGDPSQVRKDLDGVKRAVSHSAFIEYAGPFLGQSDREWFSLAR